MAVTAPMHDTTLCAACGLNEMNLCAALLAKEQPHSLHPEASRLSLIPQTVPARRTIYHPKEWSDDAFIICNGWAASSISLPDGRRQILALLLPGDIVFADSVFEAVSRRTVEAITDVTYRRYNRSKFKELILRNSDLLERFAKIWNEERTRADELTLDLGRRKSDERIARLILDLNERLAKRGMSSGNTMSFPLRQRHIADATGLTSVHVSKVLSEFQRSRLIEVGARSLTITNVAGLRQIVGPR
jgi:CRP/FNR family transcriptional regulator